MMKPLRPRHAMPGFVREAREEHELTAAYEARPPYQRNDHVGAPWPRQRV